MGLIGFLITVAASVAAGWYLKGKVDKKPEYRSSKKDIDLEEE